MANVLVIEDDEHLRFGLEFNLRRHGHAVTAVADAEAGRDVMRGEAVDLILLDIMLPGMSGLEWLEALRTSGHRGPIIVLTARAEETDAVHALSLGADDYVRKPFGVQELLARIDVILRRHATTTKNDGEDNDDSASASSEVDGDQSRTTVRVGQWTVDVANLRAKSSDGAECDLTALEVEILIALAKRPGDVVNREILLQEVWGVEAYTPTRTLDNHVARIRKKLEANPREPRNILTVHGVGYRLIENI